MKNEKGITIISLVIYVILLTFAVAGISAITSSFYGNVNELDADSKGAVAFSKVNMYILKDVKSEGVELVADSSESKFSLSIKGETVRYRVQNSSLYRNNVKICDDVQEARLEGKKEGDLSTITLYLKIKNYEKTTTYVLEPKNTRKPFGFNLNRKVRKEQKKKEDIRNGRIKETTNRN